MGQDPFSGNFKQFIHQFREALPYLEEFHRQTLVVQLPASLIRDPSCRTVEDLVLLHQVGIQLVLVHGAADEMNLPLQSAETEQQTESGEGPDSSPLSAMIRREIAVSNWELITRIRSASKNLHTISGHFIQAEPCPPIQRPDRFFNGSVVDLDRTGIGEALAQHKLLIIPSFGIGEKGRLWILEPSRLASILATRLHAKKLILLLDKTNIAPGTFQTREMNTKAMKKLLEGSHDISVEIREELEILVDACERGVQRCHLLDGRQDGMLLAELLSSPGAGLMITNSTYKKTRAARINDVQTISGILREQFPEGLVVSRTMAYIQQHIEDFLVFCIDEEIAGCCELIDFPEAAAAEIGSLAVARIHRNQGIGRDLVQSAVREAHARNHRTLFALTTSSSQVFLHCGFQLCAAEALPEKKRRNFDFQGTQVYRRVLNED